MDSLDSGIEGNIRWRFQGNWCPRSQCKVKFWPWLISQIISFSPIFRREAIQSYLGCWGPRQLCWQWYFQYFIRKILISMIGKDKEVWLKEIPAYTKKFADDKKLVAEILEILTKHNLWSKPEMCKFSKSGVKYLGLVYLTIISGSTWPTWRKFLTGLFHKNSTASHMLSDSLKLLPRICWTTNHSTPPDKGWYPFLWTKTCNQTFEGLKKGFLSAPFFEIDKCEFLDFSLGEVLPKPMRKDSKLPPVDYLSWSWIQAKQTYEIIDKELFDLVNSFQGMGTLHLREPQPTQRNCVHQPV